MTQIQKTPEQEALSHLLLSWDAEILVDWGDISVSMNRADAPGDVEWKNRIGRPEVT